MEVSNMSGETIKYPYLPSGKTILYVSEHNPYMQHARECALIHSLDEAVKTGAVLVLNHIMIGEGANGSEYHKTHECERVKCGMPTGQGYELCEGCHPKHHAEPRAIADALAQGHETKGADLYLWGHWWCCEPCWRAMIEANITNVYLLEGSEVLFNREHKENILGRWPR